MHKAVCICAFIIAACVFAGCNTEKNVTLTVLNYLDSSDPNSANDISAIWDRFEQENPDIVIIREDYYGEEFHEKTAEYLASGTLPDIINMWPGGRSAAIHDAHAVKDLRPFLERDGLDKAYNPMSLQNQYAGYLAEFPDAITYTNVLFVNKKLLRSFQLPMPRRYDDFKLMVDKLGKNGIQVIMMDNKQPWVMQSLLFSLITGRYGGADWFKKIQTGEYSFTDEWFVQSLAIVDDMCRSGIISRKTLDYEYGESQNLFAAGQAACYIGGDWKTAAFQTDRTTGQGLISKEAQEDDFELMSMPPFPGEALHDSDSGTVGTGWAINVKIPGGSAKEAAAWRLVRYLEGNYVQTYRLQVGKAFPTLRTLDIQRIAGKYHLEPFTIKRARLYKDYPVMTPVIDNVLPQEVYSVINAVLQEIIRGDVVPEDAARRVQDAWNRQSGRMK